MAGRSTATTLGRLPRSARHPPSPVGHFAARVCGRLPRGLPARRTVAPAGLAGHVIAQIEDPANLAQQGNPAYRLITLILVRCGLRITDASKILSECVVRDADGAPYLKYYNRK